MLPSKRRPAWPGEPPSEARCTFWSGKGGVFLRGAAPAGMGRDRKGCLRGSWTLGAPRGRGCGGRAEACGGWAGVASGPALGAPHLMWSLQQRHGRNLRSCTTQVCLGGLALQHMHTGGHASPLLSEEMVWQDLLSHWGPRTAVLGEGSFGDLLERAEQVCKELRTRPQNWEPAGTLCLIAGRAAAGWEQDGPAPRV